MRAPHENRLTPTATSTGSLHKPQPARTQRHIAFDSWRATAQHRIPCTNVIDASKTGQIPRRGDGETDPVPAIPRYLPYHKRGGTVERSDLTQPYFARHGDAGMQGDARGTRNSEVVGLGEYLLQKHNDATTI